MSDGRAVEEWQPIPGFPGYEASNTGLIRSYVRSKQGRIMRSQTDYKGYGRLRLRSAEGRIVGRRVHQLVAAAFIGEQPAGLVCRHLNGDKQDNRASNLAFGTVAENCRDAVLHGDHAHARRTECKYGHPYDEENTGRRGARWRKCLTCTRAIARRNYAARRAQVAS